MNTLSLNAEEHPMAGLIPTILLIVVFLLIALTLRAVGRRGEPASPTRSNSDPHNPAGQN
ncbi:MAG: hypothetical protein LC635_06070 [Pseudonocardiaceae bacterium]|nr:hypothetical protein [Pseudonocardiaceae bacterium]